MKRLAILQLILFTSFAAKSQFALVRDNDEYVNVRQEQSINSKIIGRIKSDILIEADSPNDDINDVWFATVVTASAKDIDTLKNEFICKKPNSDSILVYGYVHKSRLKFVSDMPEIKGQYKCSTNVLQFNNSSINLRIQLRKFDKASHKISRDREGYVEFIDGQEPFGVDGGLPRIEIESMRLSINGQSVKIPIKIYSNLYEMTLENVRLRSFNNDIYLDMSLNSDGAGSWGAVWVIRNGKIIKIICEQLC